MNKFAYVLLIIGGLNWLLVGIFGFDISFIFADGQANIIARIIYVLVGLSAIYLIFAGKKSNNLSSM